MQILAIDVGTGTQDILLFDTDQEPENALKMVMPSPTQIVAEAIRQATAAGADVLLTGFTMGGGPCTWAVQAHVKAGYRAYATPSAARTFDDDLEAVAHMGVRIVSDDEAKRVRGARHIVMRDVDLDAIRRACEIFGVSIEPAAVGVAVFDHGAAPPGYSDRRYRFEFLAERLRAEPALTALAFLSREIPARLTRMRAVAEQVYLDCPLLVMDTPAAAVLGALEDPLVRQANECIAVNIGNQHTLAFRLHNGRVTGLFEHHTGRLTVERLDAWIEELAAGTISNEAVYSDHGHGALLLDDRPMPLDFLSVTGPRRALLRGSRHRPYFAVPYGDMMLAGCWGLVRALAMRVPALSDIMGGRSAVVL